MKFMAVETSCMIICMNFHNLFKTIDLYRAKNFTLELSNEEIILIISSEGSYPRVNTHINDSLVHISRILIYHSHVSIKFRTSKILFSI